MPPRRKSKATKATAMPLRAPPASAASNKRRQGTVHSLQGAKMSRLAPSIPFQMTTRRKGKTSSNHSSPAGPSSASSGSRRSSLNDIEHFEDATSDLEDARPAKRSRTSSDSGSPRLSHGSLSNNTLVNGVQTPELRKPASAATLAAPKTSGKKRRASDDSTQSSKTLSARQNGVLTRTQSDVSEHQPRRKKRKTTEVPADSADQPPDLTDATTAPNSPDQNLDVDGSQTLQNVLPTAGDAPAKSGRRLPGRRRQPHPDVNIETDLRRQLNLKMSYRSVAKMQKNLLEELSNRTLKNLNNNPNYHTQCPEYKPLMTELDQRRDSRLDQINALRTYRLEQLERVRVAEERIQKEQYINRFHDLQDDLLLQCYFRMKQIEREMKGKAVDATDDEDNILPPTYTDERHHNNDDRIGSKYASRSRAYVEADRQLEDDARRRRFNHARAVFVENDDDADDSIEEVSGGFARFEGPDRMESVAHYNIASLADAALELERRLSPKPDLPRLQVIPNQHAFQLMMLAELSAQQTQTNDPQDRLYNNQQAQQQLPSSSRASTPVIKQELTRHMSPVDAPSSTLPSKPSQAAHSSTTKNNPTVVDLTPQVLHPEAQAASTGHQTEPAKNATPVRFSTHRIMDLLNDDQDVPVSRSRESQLPAQDAATPSRRESVGQYSTASQGGHLRLETTIHKQETPVDQALMDALAGPSQPPSDPPPSSPLITQPWQRASLGPSQESDDALRRRDPLNKIRELLDRKAREQGREPPGRSQYLRGPEPVRHSSSQHSQDRPDVVGYDPQRPSAGLYTASPNITTPYPQAPRRESQDQSHQHWDRDRRPSVTQASQQPSASLYRGGGGPLYPSEQQKAPSNPSTHQSPYPKAPASSTLPPKPPGPPPSVPINFRFAHYDPVPSRQPYPPQSPNYPPVSHQVVGPPLQQYAPSYGAPPVYQSSYVPPPGSFQAPPPQPSSTTPYPPLKIQQYGGQPILPANMAPPPQAGPPMPYGVPPAQPQQQAGFSPTQAHPPPNAHFDGQHGDRASADPMARPRRQYRSWQAHGTQFREYQGPGSDKSWRKSE